MQKRPISFFVLWMILFFLQGCSLLQVKNSEITLPTVPLVGIRSHEKGGGTTIAAGVSSHDRIEVYDDALVNPPIPDTKGSPVSLGRLHSLIAIGIVKAFDLGCANNRCYGILDFSRLWNLQNWVLSVGVSRNFEYTSEAFDSTNKRWSRGDLILHSKTLSVGYLVGEGDLLYTSITQSSGDLVTVVHQDQTNIELSRSELKYSGWQILGGYERQNLCDLITVSNCFSRLEIALTQQPGVGFNGVTPTLGMGALLGVRW